VEEGMSAFSPNSDRESGHPMVDRRGQRVQTLWSGVQCQTSFVAANEAAFQRTAALPKFRICC
jgi:hypothetical protein